MKKGRVDLDIKSLTETPDNLCLKADSTGKLTCVTQAGLLKKTAKQKMQQFADLDANINDSV